MTPTTSASGQHPYCLPPGNRRVPSCGYHASHRRRDARFAPERPARDPASAAAPARA